MEIVPALMGVRTSHALTQQEGSLNSVGITAPGTNIETATSPRAFQRADLNGAKTAKEAELLANPLGLGRERSFQIDGEERNTRCTKPVKISWEDDRFVAHWVKSSRERLVVDLEALPQVQQFFGTLKQKYCPEMRDYVYFCLGAAVAIFCCR